MRYPQRKLEPTKLTSFISKLGAIDSLVDDPSAPEREKEEIVVEQLDERQRQFSFQNPAVAMQTRTVNFDEHHRFFTETMHTSNSLPVPSLRRRKGSTGSFETADFNRSPVQQFAREIDFTS